MTPKATKADSRPSADEAEESHEMSIADLKAMLRTQERRKILVFKFGGTTAGSDKETARLRDARHLIERKIEEGYFVVPVFSAYKRLASDRSPAVGITDLLLSYRDIIASEENERDGVREFRNRLLEPHIELMRDLELVPQDFELKDLQKAGFKGKARWLEEFLREANAIVGDAATFNKFIPGQGAIDHFVSGGERLEVIIVAAYLNKKWKESDFPWKAVPATARDIGVLTDDKFGDANILDDSLRLIYSLINKYRKRGEIPIVTGFDGVYKTKDEHGRDRRYTTTLGRSGSDLTATYIGYAMTAEATYLIKDTDGVLTADPRYVPAARTIDFLSYDLAVEAGNIMSKAVLPAMNGNMDLIVLNPKNPGVFTRIGPHRGATGPVLITNPERCRYVRLDLKDRLSMERFFDELRRYEPKLFEFYYTGEHISYIHKGAKLPRRLEDFLVRETGLEVVEIPAFFFQVVGYMTRDDVVRFSAFINERRPLSGPRWFEKSKSMNVCLPEEGTDMKAVLQEIHAEFIEK